MLWHPLDDDDDNPEPDWGQRHEGGPRPVPDTVITMRVLPPAPAEPPPRPKPRPKPTPKPRPVKTRYGEDGPLLDELNPPAAGLWRAGVSRRATMSFYAVSRRVRPTPDEDLSDPVVDTPGGLIRRSRSPMGNHRGDLDQIELQAYEQKPRFVRMMRRRHFAHWRA